MTQDINSPAGIAQTVTEALQAQGAKVRIGTVDNQSGGRGFIDVQTPDGQTYRLQIEATW